MIVLHTVCRQTKVLRKWPHFAELADLLISDGHVVAFSGSQRDLDEISEVTRQIKSPSGWYVHPTMNLKDFAFLLHGSRLFVTINTGVMHLAIALKIPTFAIIGGTPAEIIVRPSKIFRYVEDPGLIDYPDYEPRMVEITCSQVYGQIREMLGEADTVQA